MHFVSKIVILLSFVHVILFRNKIHKARHVLINWNCSLKLSILLAFPSKTTISKCLHVFLIVLGQILQMKSLNVTFDPFKHLSQAIHVFKGVGESGIHVLHIYLEIHKT